MPFGKQVDECLNPEGPSSLDGLGLPSWTPKSLADAEGFFERLDDCLARAAQCAREAETEAADRALAAANADLRSAVQILEAGGAAGVAQLAGAFKGASAAVPPSKISQILEVRRLNEELTNSGRTCGELSRNKSSKSSKSALK